MLVPIYPASIGACAVLVRDDGYVGLQKRWGWGASGGGVAPPRDGGRLPGVERGLGAGQTDGRHRGGEVDRGSEGDDGEVEVCGGLVVAGVRGDGRDVVPVRHIVAGVVLAQENLHFRCQQCLLSTMRRRL